MKNKWRDEKQIRPEQYGREAIVECYEKYVVKIYNRRYFKYNELPNH